MNIASCLIKSLIVIPHLTKISKKSFSYITFQAIYSVNLVQLTDYSLKSYFNPPNGVHIWNWVIECSNDGVHWDEVDRRTDCQTLNNSETIFIVLFNLDRLDTAGMDILIVTVIISISITLNSLVSCKNLQTNNYLYLYSFAREIVL